MSRKVRHSFAAPLVLIAVTPACLVRTAPAPPPPATGSNADTTVRPTVNPPRPTTAPPAVPDRAPNPDTSPGTVGPASPQQGPNLGSWTVTRSPSDGKCYAQVKVDCPPKPATCNPPPPRVMASCPSGIAMDRPVQIVEHAPDDCYVEVPAPACPPNVMCNPPPPQQVACPQ